MYVHTSVVVSAKRLPGVPSPDRPSVSAKGLPGEDVRGAAGTRPGPSEKIRKPSIPEAIDYEATLVVVLLVASSSSCG